ncbi:DNA alkylation repair protein [Yoonia sp.]|uniref:DNA alkylation repair protein n=1 Tax=Yoonia sp. TaxID=2212373 RepID=UPI0019E8A16E|nr:DNA alkylation repair protein [Yoonia sp.]MBE0413167.1 DNA alkylation repair protein [Yoonia sp.]
MKTSDALAALRDHAAPAKASAAHRYHKVDRPYLGVTNPVIDALAKDWRAALDPDTRLVLARGLWKSNIHEARIIAAKLLTQARIRPDDSDAWNMIVAWLPDCDSLPIADAVCTAGQKRLVADPARLDLVATWITSDNPWMRRPAFAMTLPWAKLNHPKAGDLALRERVLDWAAQSAADPDRIVARALAGWLRDLSKHDPDRVRAFLDTYGDTMPPATAKAAAAHLAP